MREAVVAGGEGFDAATTVHRVDERTFRGRVEDGWDMGGVPNGGYLMAIASAALLEQTQRTDVVALSAHFLRPAGPGPVDLRVEVLREGRRHSSAAVSLHQGEEEAVRVLATLGELDGVHRATLWGATPPDLPGPDECVHARPMPGMAFRPPPIAERVELRLNPEDVRFTVGLAGERPRMTGWARLADGRPPDTRSLPLFADAFPPAIFNAGPPLAWVPTIDLSLQVRKRPAAGWLRCAFATRVLSGGYLEEDGELWDADGDLVALSRQLALAPRADSAAVVGSPHEGEA